MFFGLCPTKTASTLSTPKAKSSTAVAASVASPLPQCSGRRWKPTSNTVDSPAHDGASPVYRRSPTAPTWSPNSSSQAASRKKTGQYWTPSSRLRWHSVASLDATAASSNGPPMSAVTRSSPHSPAASAPSASTSHVRNFSLLLGWGNLSAIDVASRSAAEGCRGSRRFFAAAAGAAAGAAARGAGTASDSSSTNTG